MRKNNLSSARGFTLIELLVVIAIIGLLSTIAVVALSSARAKGRDAKRVADIRQVQTALELYLGDKGSYPGVDAAVVPLGGTVANTGKILCSSGLLDLTACPMGGTTYMGVVPRDPGKKSSDAADACPVGAVPDLAPCDYAYKRTASDKYEVMFDLESDTGSLKKGPNCASEVGIINGATCRH